MSELDVAKEQIAYLKFWLGIFVVTDISLFGWVLSNVESANLLLVFRGLIRNCSNYCGYRVAAPPNRATDRKSTGALAMETIVAALLVVVSLVLLGVAIDATRHPK